MYINDIFLRFVSYMGRREDCRKVLCCCSTKDWCCLGFSMPFPCYRSHHHNGKPWRRSIAWRHHSSTFKCLSIAFAAPDILSVSVVIILECFFSLRNTELSQLSDGVFGHKSLSRRRTLVFLSTLLPRSLITPHAVHFINHHLGRKASAKLS